MGGGGAPTLSGGGWGGGGGEVLGFSSEELQRSNEGENGNSYVVAPSGGS